MDLQDLFEKTYVSKGANVPSPVSVIMYLFCPIFLSVSASHCLQSVLYVGCFLCLFLAFFSSDPAGSSILCYIWYLPLDILISPGSLLCLVPFWSVFWNHDCVSADSKCGSQ